MIGGIQTTGLSQMFRQQTNQYSRVLEQIASGQRFNRPSDDFASFMRVNTMQSDNRALEAANRELGVARSAGTNAISFGDQVFEALTELRDLSEAWGNAASGSAEQTNILNDFNARAASLEQFRTENNDGAFTATVGDITFNIAALDIGALGGAGDPGEAETGDMGGMTAAIDDLLAGVAGNTATANAFNATVNRQITINENTMAATGQSISAVRDIDEMRTIQEATSLEIRRNASVSMMIQANVSQGVVARLFV